MSAKSYIFYRRPRCRKALASKVRPKARPPSAYDDLSPSTWNARCWKRYRKKQYKVNPHPES